ncbi:MAG: GNAT family N-acetyltransferase [Candidatus Marsarchaeota archaeon]|nr:GNAT family N-acetyltransferase [Candidatus Marsarchaeota archaeon]
MMLDIEMAHYRFMKGIFFAGAKQTKDALFLYSDKIDDEFWNYAAKISLKGKSLSEFLKTVVDFYSKLDRAPAIYLTSNAIRQNTSLLSKNGFVLKYADAWMVHNGNVKVQKITGLQIKKVSSKKDFDSFIRVFGEVYGDNGTGPYAGLPKSYIDVLRESFSKGKGNNGTKVKYYIALMNGKPVGCGTLVHDKKAACLYSLGVLPKYRGKGIARTITMTRIHEAKSNRINTVFLQTEKGSYNEKLFRKFGFKTVFVGKCYSLREK